MRIVFPRLRTLLACLALLATTGHAMTVIAPTFDELVASADVVVRGVVTDVHCISVDTSQGTAIKTLVTLRVERALKGSPGAEVTLSFLGGKLGRRTLTVVGMPTFKVGDRQIVFVANNGRVICPLIAAGHGRYHVRTDPATGREYVARDNGAPLTATSEIVTPLDQAPRAASPSDASLSVDAFEARILNAVQGNPTAAQP